MRHPYSQRVILLSLFFLFSLASSQVLAAAKRKTFSSTLLLGFPHPTNLGLDYQFANKWSLGITGGYLGVQFNYPGLGMFRAETVNLEGRFRFFPFSRGFFVGVAGGYQRVSGETSRSLNYADYSISAAAIGRVKSYYVIPHLGWFSVGESGFTFGMEVGAYIPLSAETQVDITSSNPLISSLASTPEYRSLQNDAQSFGNQLGRFPLPFLTALRLGWSF